jgi:hypothetical protein
MTPPLFAIIIMANCHFVPKIFATICKVFVLSSVPPLGIAREAISLSLNIESNVNAVVIHWWKKCEKLFVKHFAYRFELLLRIYFQICFGTGKKSYWTSCNP